MASIICSEYKVNEQIAEVKFRCPEQINQPAQKSKENSEAHSLLCVFIFFFAVYVSTIFAL